MSLSRRQISDLEGLLKHPGWKLFAQEAERRLEVAHRLGIEVEDVGASESERARVAWRAVRGLIAWPADQINDFYGSEEHVDE